MEGESPTLNQNLVIGSFLETGFEATLSLKRMFWAFEKSIFYFIFLFLVLSEEVKTLFWKSEKESSRPFKFKIARRMVFRKWFWSDLEIKNECSEHLESKFPVFGKFWVTKLKPIFGMLRQNMKHCLNQNLVIGTFLENCFEASLSSRINIVDVWKQHFLVFCKFLIDEVETIFWESKAKCSNF